MVISVPDLMEKCPPAPWELSVRLAGDDPAEGWAIREQTREQLAGLLTMSGPIDDPDNAARLRGLFLADSPPAAETWGEVKLTALLTAVFAYAKQRDERQLQAFVGELAKFIEKNKA